MTPTTIQKIGDTLAIAWPDGREDYHPLRRVRDLCPCAVCHGEPDVTGQRGSRGVDPLTANCDLTAWEWVGGYGWQPHWGDGHRTGIYSFLFLRKMGDPQ